MTGAPEPSRLCQSCHDALDPAHTGWECECGVAVCDDPSCFEEYFKHVAGGEATRCFTCGIVT
jgi:hypothetical protein